MTALVFSYSHADEAQRNELEKNLSPLKQMGKITTWHDPESFMGKSFEHQIKHYFFDIKRLYSAKWVWEVGRD